jgi:hypothetical protein
LEATGEPEMPSAATPFDPNSQRVQKAAYDVLPWFKQRLCDMADDFSADDDDARFMQRIKVLVKAFRLDKQNMKPLPSVIEPDADSTKTEAASIRGGIAEALGWR